MTNGQRAQEVTGKSIILDWAGENIVWMIFQVKLHLTNVLLCLIKSRILIEHCNQQSFRTDVVIFLVIEWIERPLVAEEGTGLGGHGGGSSGKTLDECKAWCVETGGCNSIVWRDAGDCWLKDRCVTAEEPSNECRFQNECNGFKTYYIPCTGSGMFMLGY